MQGWFGNKMAAPIIVLAFTKQYICRAANASVHKHLEELIHVYRLLQSTVTVIVSKFKGPFSENFLVTGGFFECNTYRIMALDCI